MSAAIGEELARRLPQFLRARLPDARSVEVTDVSRMTGGYSCVTHRFTAVVDGREMTLLTRADTPPDQKVVQSGDRSEEWVLLSALAKDGRVPMPKPLFCDEDGSELGAKTIVLEFKAGGSFLKHVRATPDGQLQARADALADLAADIHAVGVDAVPASLERPPDWDSYVERLIETWREVEREHIGSEPLFRYMAVWLDENRPPPTPLTLVHGEFQVSNVVIGDAGELLGIDWEYARVGDPREDLGWALWVGAVQPPDLVGLDLESFCRRYRERSGLTSDVVNPLTVAYFSILPSVKVVRGALDQQRGVIEGTNTSIQAAYMGGGIVTAQEQWLLAARRIRAAMRPTQEASA
jgi:aminoglycoside phosphotransferase (APT) family kinase protein